MSRRLLPAAAVFAVPAAAFANNLGGFSEVSGGGAVIDPRAAILNILLKVTSYVGLIATVVIIIAGIYLLTSMGEEAQKDKAKKIIIYAIVGIIVIALASALVMFLISVVS